MQLHSNIGQPQDIPYQSNIFSAIHTLPVEHTDMPFYAYPIVDNKTNTLTQSQMLKTAEDSHKFISSQVKEIEGLLKMGVFDVQHISTIPAYAKLLSSILELPLKKEPHWHICVDGSQQQHGRDFWDVYAPVVSWLTIHLLLLLSSILDLKQWQVDYTQAFPQAPLYDSVYVCVPQGWFIDETSCLKQHLDPTFQDRSFYIKLKRNLYGCKQAACNWFQHLTQGLLSEAFQQSSNDHCLFLWRDCIILIVYMDDCIIFAKDDHIIDALIQGLSISFLLEGQGSVHDYLGIRITKDPVMKSIHMSQPGLIESVLQGLNLLQDAKTQDTPPVGILYPDCDGIPCQDKWHYHSVIGELNYIAQNTHPDISFAVHQCTRYSTQPSALHELAVKHISRYLLATKDKGLLLHPTNKFKLDMFVDADFACIWHREYSELRDFTLSRTGYIITYCGCPDEAYIE